MVFGEWLTKYKLDDMDKGDRSRLFSVMDNLAMIEEWRQKLTLSERLKLNHPTSVLRKWKAAIEPAKPKSDKPTLRDSVVNLSEESAAKDREIEELKAHAAELEAARGTTALPNAEAGVTGALGLLVAHITNHGPSSERDLSEFLAAAPAFDVLDLIELTKWLKDLAGYWKAHERRAAKKVKAETEVPAEGTG